jgi:hypothetical protein
MATPLHAPKTHRTPAAPGASAAPRLAFKRRRPHTARDTVRAMGVAFVVASLMGSGALLNKAEQLPYGNQRDVAVELAGGLDRVANLLSLNRPADRLNAALGREAPKPLDLTTLTTVPPTTASTTPLDVNPVTGQRWITPEEPLRLLLAGDSMMRELGTSVEDLAPPDLTEPSIDYRVSSGLARPDFFDWPAHLAETLDNDRPEAIVLLFGTNDYQDLELEGQGVVEAGSPPWMAEYGRRVGLVMDLLHRQGVTVHWIGLPPMRSSSFSQAMASLNATFAQQAASRPWVSYVDLGPTLAGPDGGYAAYLPGAGGDVGMRQEDGVHLSRAGSDRAANVLLADIARRWGIGQSG